MTPKGKAIEYLIEKGQLNRIHPFYIPSCLDIALKEQAKQIFEEFKHFCVKCENMPHHYHIRVKTLDTMENKWAKEK